MSREGALPDAKALLKLLQQFELYDKELLKLPFSAHTRRAYQTRLQHFLGFLGTHLDRYPNALSNKAERDGVIADYMTYLRNEIKSSPQTINAYLTAIDSFFSFVGLGKANAPREENPQFPPQTLSPTDQVAFVNSVQRCKRARDRALATLLLNTGIRVAECQRLDLDDVLIHENKGLIKVRGVNGKPCRQIVLNASCRSAMQDWLVERGRKYPQSTERGFFISNRTTRLSIDAIDHLIRKMATAAGLRYVSSDTLRHTCLTNLLWHGADVAFVARISGHKKTSTTMRYRRQSAPKVDQNYGAMP